MSDINHNDWLRKRAKSLVVTHGYGDLMKGFPRFVDPPTWTPYPALTDWYIRRADLTFTKEGFHEPRPIEGE